MLSEKIYVSFELYRYQSAGQYIYELLLQGQQIGPQSWYLLEKPKYQTDLCHILVDEKNLFSSIQPDDRMLYDKGPCVVNMIDSGAQTAFKIDFGGQELFGVYHLEQYHSHTWTLSVDARATASWHTALSAGGVVVSLEDGQPKVVLIRPLGKRYWTLPKGTIEVDETPAQAALREVWEETGVTATLVAPIAPIEFSFFTMAPNDAKRKVFKLVYYYLMRADHKADFTAKEEVAQVEWFSFKQASSVLSHGTERAMLEQAIKIWQQLKPQ